MVRDGYLYGLGLGLAGIACGLALSPWAAAPPLAAALFCLYFFRDPERSIPDGDVCVSPADGRVVLVRRLPGGSAQVSIFLNIFDVHVNRIPVSGSVRSVSYTPGSFRSAHLRAASEGNEQNAVVIEDARGRGTVEVRQIAGLIARRIVCHARQGDAVEKGQRFGLIKFGSRVDVLLGSEWELAVGRGARVAGGTSVLARRK